MTTSREAMRKAQEALRSARIMHTADQHEVVCLPPEQFESLRTALAAPEGDDAKRIRAQALEDAAQACEARGTAYRNTKAPGWFEVDHETTQCAAAIRAMSSGKETTHAD